MAIYKFKCWVEKAVSGIIFPPDKIQVATELYHHLEDHCDALVAQGYSAEDAQRLAVEAMGDAREIAPQLAALHRPFWGYFLRITRILLVILALITVIPFGKFLYEGNFQKADFFDYYREENGSTLEFYDKPGVSFTAEGYTFTVKEVMQWYNEAYGTDTFCLLMTEFHPLPWAVHGEVGCWFWAEDSQGNRYESHYSTGPDSEGAVLYTYDNNTSPFTHTYEMWINGGLTGSQWLDIHYDRDGRNYVLHIDLTGGDGA